MFCCIFGMCLVCFWHTFGLFLGVCFGLFSGMCFVLFWAYGLMYFGYMFGLFWVYVWLSFVYMVRFCLGNAGMVIHVWIY